MSKTAQKILRSQKQPAGPTLFLGNLGFEATEQSIRNMLDSHRNKPEGEEASDEKWIRKIRMGTFEDSGKCKGYVSQLLRRTLQFSVPFMKQMGVCGLYIH